MIQQQPNDVINSVDIDCIMRYEVLRIEITAENIFIQFNVLID